MTFYRRSGRKAVEPLPNQWVPETRSRVHQVLDLCPPTVLRQHRPAQQVQYGPGYYHETNVKVETTCDEVYAAEIDWG